jgi:hypothetical protein
MLGFYDCQNSSLPATNAKRLRKGAQRRSNPAFFDASWIASLRSQ